jgi:hypothetical protein
MQDQLRSPTATLAAPRPAVDATPLVDVRPLDYLHLRLLAESAAGVENQSVDFVFPQGRIMERRQPGAPLTPTDVLIPTYTPGKRPRNTVRFGLGEHDDPALPNPMPLAAADAVFWSDAAVHKFVIPYVASVGGESAAEWVGLVELAWNFYPEKDVEVYALVHTTSVETGVELDPSLSLWVAYVEKGQTEIAYATIPQFLNRYGCVEPVDAPRITVPYQRGTGPRGPHRPDYAALRAMAEWAASLRDEHAYFVFRPGEKGFRPPSCTPPKVESGDIVVPTYSPTTPCNRKALPGVFFQPQGHARAQNLAKKGDALFWSSGSIEQFLVPYYASKGGLQALPDLSRMARVWEGTGPGAVRRPGWDDVRSGFPAPAGETQDEVFALIHLPSSQWTEVDSGATTTHVSPASQLRLMTAGRDGMPRRRALSHFTGRR